MDTVEKLREKLQDALARVEELERQQQLYPAEHHDPKGPVMWWLEITDKKTGQPELVCAGLLSARNYPGLKWFSYLPTFKELPCPVALPKRAETGIPLGATKIPTHPKAPIKARRKPGFNLDGNPRKKRMLASVPSTAQAGT